MERSALDNMINRTRDPRTRDGLDARRRIPKRDKINQASLGLVTLPAMQGGIALLRMDLFHQGFVLFVAQGSAPAEEIPYGSGIVVFSEERFHGARIRQG